MNNSELRLSEAEKQLIFAFRRMDAVGANLVLRFAATSVQAYPQKPILKLLKGGAA